MIKKKGSIVPKRFLRAIEKRSQHLAKFGCDVEIIGNTIYPITEGSAICIPSIKYCNTKKNKRLVKGFEFQPNCCIDSSRVNNKIRSNVFTFDISSPPISATFYPDYK
jgi:hypothetical protein